MFTRSILPTARIGARRLATRNASSAPHSPEHVGSFRAFFRAAPMPIEAYPLAGLVVIMLGWATYHSAKHIREDRDHLRWYPGAGGVDYQEPQWKALPVDL